MEKNKALALGMEYCARSEKSTKETRNFLASKGVNPEHIDGILAQLKEEGFIDDLRYATAFVADKYRFNSWGRKKISYQLGSKGIPSSIINKALETLDSDQYYEHLTEQLEKKLGSIKGGSYYDKKAKLIRFAAARGYEMDLIYNAIDELLKK